MIMKTNIMIGPKMGASPLPPLRDYNWYRFRGAGQDIDAHRFMRWSEPREFGILATYDQTRYEEIDEAILLKHPFIKIWEDVLPYLLQFNRQYRLMNCNTYDHCKKSTQKTW
jgi:poly-beta-hydroxyalkanoate depolymerase